MELKGLRRILLVEDNPVSLNRFRPLPFNFAATAFQWQEIVFPGQSSMVFFYQAGQR
jgi:hypothetical protein